MSEFKHGPHCIPREDYVLIFGMFNRLRDVNRELATKLREEQKENAALRERLAKLLSIEGRTV